MAGDDDYHTPGGGLKLKGSKPSGIKKKKKKPSSSSTSTASRDRELQKVAQDDTNTTGASSSKNAPPDANDDDDDDDAHLRSLEDRDAHDGKTAAERAAEETRRKRLADRLAREGTKTHKERVEELNKYLSTLSEHHDMPRIGPG